eukprot:CAMPEP_0185902320 /NCGR_PEP_ID=MMETSP0196C-20130402/1570_1 /TAXON_ID=2932 /ORGANISM="Alexandrium fundyense, Strain CCMP1719" /LENGTH=45 /DNA_ID= /DNA_START= /DNA_END= /DNA_ORIENTATION=
MADAAAETDVVQSEPTGENQDPEKRLENVPTVKAYNNTEFLTSAV